MAGFILYPNPKRSWWLMRYNALVTKIKSGKLKFPEGSWLGKHHVIPRSERPDLQRDQRNIVVLPFTEHMDLHYFLWRAEPTRRHAQQLWWGCVYGRKNKLWDLPGGDRELEKLKKCLRKKHDI